MTMTTTVTDTAAARRRHANGRRRRRRPNAASAVAAAATAALASFPPLSAAASGSGSLGGDTISLFNDLTQQQQESNPFLSGVPFHNPDPAVYTTMEVSSGTVYASCPDLQYITGPMHESDADGNGYLNQEEYASFAQAISGGTLPDAWFTSFRKMPIQLKETYLVLSCLCELYPDAPGWGGRGCCTASEESESDKIGIRVEGTAPGDEMDEVTEAYLTYVCGTMATTLDGVGGSLVAPPTGGPTPLPTAGVTPAPTRTPEPTKNPTPMPTPTPDPTARPTTLEPTRKPVTPPPVIFPTKNPTPSPSTPQPTKSPTEKPTTQSPTTSQPTTKKPTTTSPVQPQPGTPTAQPAGPGTPTKDPTPAPYLESYAPTKAPAPQSVAPTKAPTPGPVAPGAPTKSPTPQPIAPGTPTKSPTPQPVAPGTPTKAPTPQPVAPGTPTKAPTPPPVPTEIPTFSPTAAPTISTAPTGHPTAAPSVQPTVSFAPTVSPAPSSAPTGSPRPTTSASPTRLAFTGDIPASVNFVASLNGKVTAREIMEGETNQVKVMLEEQLLVLSDIVIQEEFYNNGTGTDTGTDTDTGNDTNSNATADGAAAASSTESGVEPNRLMRKLIERKLAVEKATLATLDSVEDVQCPSSKPDGAQENAATPKDCLSFNNTILLYMVDEYDELEKVQIFENAMIAKIASGWLVQNFDLNEALKPPPAPAPAPGTDGTDKSLESKPLSVGAIIGIIALVLTCFVLTALFGDKYRRNRKNARDADGDEYDLERQMPAKDSELAQDDLIPPPSPGADDSSSMYTEDKSFSSQEHLLQGQLSSTADLPPALGEMKTEDDSEVGESIYSEVGESIYSEGDEFDNLRDASPRAASSPLSAMAAASTLVASTTPPATPTNMESYSPIDFGSDRSASTAEDYPAASPGETGAMAAAATASPVAAAAAAGGTGGAGGGSGPASTPGDGGLSAGAAAAIGAAGAGVLAAGAYAATRGRSKSRSKSPSKKEEEESKASTQSTPSAMDELDNAIEAGNWGQVGALAAVLASQGAGSPAPKKSPRSAGAISASRSDSSRGSLEQARAVEIDRLVEAGDWQGVVLAAARFEADQTFDGESFSASASQSSRWTGSATSATTPRSMATTDQSASNLSSQRDQAEIRAEVEALVRRVVPEEADNIDEMMTQFKGREEELVETLRRMQERAIASRARLAVQKSAKLEARAKASPRGTAVGSSSQSVASASSTKSELEQAIESGNWQAVGAAAQKMSDSSVGALSMEEKARLRDAVSKSPAFSGRGAGKDEDNLDLLIERGDWQGVIAAAKRASEGGDQGISQEEQEALAQANMWQAIANQSKQEARQGPAGAGDAAAWAISRSLNALNSPGESSSAVRTINDIADEESDASQYESSSYGDSAGRSREDYRRGI